MRKLLFILILIQPLVHKLTLKLGFSFEIYNELVALLLFCLLGIKLIRTKRINWLILLFSLFVGYCLMVVYIRGSYLTGLLQLIIYSQFFIYYFYFSLFSTEKKVRAIHDLKVVLNVFLSLSIFIAIVELMNPTIVKNFFGVISFERGLGGYNLISFFGSGPSYAGFLILYIFIWFYFHFSLKEKVNRKDLFFIISAVILLVLTFSRKEVLFGILFITFFPYPNKNKIIAVLKKVFLVTIMVSGLVFYYFTFFSEANSRAFSEDYVRWKIMKYSVEVSQDYFPLGSGVGSFGSQMSSRNDFIYKKYKMGPSITGYNGKRGPIYDAFLFTFISELGIGFIFIFIFFYILYHSATIGEETSSKFIKKSIIIYLFFLSIFTPVISTYFGYMSAVMLGIIINSVNNSIFKIK